MGYKMHYLQRGTGPDVLLLHGIGASFFVWRKIIPDLQKKYKVTALDILGFGKSDKPESFAYDLDSQCTMISEFIKKMGIQKCIVIGSSMGGMIALRLNETQPLIFYKTILISPAYDPNLVPVSLNKVSFLSPIFSPLVNEQFVRQVLKRVYSNHELISPEIVQAYLEPYSDGQAISSFVKSFALIKDPRVLADLTLVTTPTLVLWGEKDKIIPIKYAHKLKKIMKTAQLLIHPKAGHHTHEECPSWTLEKIHQFLE